LLDGNATFPEFHRECFARRVVAQPRCGDLLEEAEQKQNGHDAEGRQSSPRGRAILYVCKKQICYGVEKQDNGDRDQYQTRRPEYLEWMRHPEENGCCDCAGPSECEQEPTEGLLETRDQPHYGTDEKQAGCGRRREYVTRQLGPGDRKEKQAKQDPAQE